MVDLPPRVRRGRSGQRPGRPGAVPDRRSQAGDLPLPRRRRAHLPGRQARSGRRRRRCCTTSARGRRVLRAIEALYDAGRRTRLRRRRHPFQPVQPGGGSARCRFPARRQARAGADRARAGPCRTTDADGKPQCRQRAATRGSSRPKPASARSTRCWSMARAGARDRSTARRCSPATSPCWCAATPRPR